MSDHDELLVLYEQATQDIRTFQDRQASVTNLTVLVYGALVLLTVVLGVWTRSG